jgi:hypothetical protein
VSDEDLAADEWFRLANRASDLEWWTAMAESSGIGHCGGCGGDNCHPGSPCGDVRGFDHGVCDLCSQRLAEGQISFLRVVS